MSIFPWVLKLIIAVSLTNIIVSMWFIKRKKIWGEKEFQFRIGRIILGSIFAIPFSYFWLQKTPELILRNNPVQSWWIVSVIFGIAGIGLAIDGYQKLSNSKAVEAYFGIVHLLTSLIFLICSVVIVLI